MGGVYLWYINVKGPNQCYANIDKLNYLDVHSMDMKPPATLHEQNALKEEIAKQRAYLSTRVVLWFPPTPDWCSLPMDDKYH